MNSWHLAVQRFNEVREIIKWMHNVDLTGWNPDDSWRNGLLLPDELENRLEDIDVFGDFFWVTTLRGHYLVELSCTDLAPKSLIKRYGGDHDIFAVPSYLIRYPEFDREEVSQSEVWHQIRAAAEQKKLWSDDAPSTVYDDRGKPLWLFAVTLYRNEHWCAVAVNFNDLTITVLDPQRTGDRYEALRKYLYADLVPLLPQPPSPKRYRFKQLEWMTQVDSYNCGVFVIMFFEMLLLDVAVVGSESASESTIAMQYFRYRFIAIY
ncbi:Ulp1 protease family C-terminal catalytic domain-containing protein [Phytophthora infestans]|uniref:Ulp1 protease family C-terminal catalytic domain-containing protein n=1 Tax=Phytophthora infestans TaxID=4787 RepID=A0A8S9UN91_PHYIN|nr:Ulp1 protease family C-terminal catalytic domain-containing protein [Phytophthora infestans]